MVRLEDGLSGFRRDTPKKPTSRKIADRMMMICGLNFAASLPATNPPMQKKIMDMVKVMESWDKDQPVYTSLNGVLNRDHP